MSADGPDAREAFLEAIREVHRTAGSPSYRALSMRTGIASGTIGNLLNGVGAPRWSTIAPFVQACDPGGANGKADLGAWRLRYLEVFGSMSQAEEPMADISQQLLRLRAELHALTAAQDPLVERLVRARLADFVDEVASWARKGIVLRRPASHARLIDHYRNASAIHAVTTPGFVSIWDTNQGRELAEACARPECHCVRIFRYASTAEARAQLAMMRRQHNLGIQVLVVVDEDSPGLPPGVPTEWGLVRDYGVIDRRSVAQSVEDSAGNTVADRWLLNSERRAAPFLEHMERLRRMAVPLAAFADSSAES